MIIYCPRCRQPLSVEGLEDRKRYVTCPACLERITLGPATPPALPIPALPLNYQGPSGDIEAELQTDLKFVIGGIVAFAVMALVGFGMARGLFGGGASRGFYSALLGWIAVVTTIVAIVSLLRHRARAQRIRAGELVRMKTTGERVARVVVLGISGLFLIAITGVAAIVLLLVACLVMVGGSGFR